jgi:dTDP-4-dehydrorhamnose 3,5-epimerase
MSYNFLHPKQDIDLCEELCMHCTPTPLAGLLVLEPKVFHDDRGFFFESFNQRTFEAATGISKPFVQHNHSHSTHNVVRGLHYQIQQPQGKLVRVLSGSIHDVAVDIRRSSPTCGQWFAINLSAENKQQLWIPEGFAHGFSVTSDCAEIAYLTTDYWAPPHERTIRWDDPQLSIRWPLRSADAIISPKDANGISFAEAELFA